MFKVRPALHACRARAKAADLFLISSRPVVIIEHSLYGDHNPKRRPRSRCIQARRGRADARRRDHAPLQLEIRRQPVSPYPCNHPEPVALSHIAFHEGFNPMNFRAVVSSIALSALGLTLATSATSAAEFALAPAHRAAAVQGGLVFWDDVYPPAIYGPQLRSVEEVAAMKAQARPVSERWWGYWYVR
ncbi:hypothetical protein [Bradyrhizobium sp. CCBAU 11357]|uniref:hypothetical protein n=1 Tax=Bradyrhizobium sp. CCBAU 11357 TaxID=1630808 RepID=UPI0023043D0A|nr:hypothetical protein [Bradyrhizobium sp. CCBAU 11357]